MMELMYKKHGVQYMAAQLKSVHEREMGGTSVDSNNIEIVDALNKSVMSHQGAVT